MFFFQCFDSVSLVTGRPSRLQKLHLHQQVPDVTLWKTMGTWPNLENAPEEENG